jgi:hypothetical protein
MYLQVLLSQLGVSSTLYLDIFKGFFFKRFDRGNCNYGIVFDFRHPRLGLAKVELHHDALPPELPYVLPGLILVSHFPFYLDRKRKGILIVLSINACHKCRSLLNALR